MNDTFTLPNNEIIRISAIKFLRDSDNGTSADILTRSKIEFGNKARRQTNGKIGLVVTLRCSVSDVTFLETAPDSEWTDKSDEFWSIRSAISKILPADMEIDSMEPRSVLVDRLEFDKSELERLIEAQKDLMIAVATGGPTIASVNDTFKERRAKIAMKLREDGKRDPNPFDDLWAWYGRWKNGDLPKYQDRRKYVQDLYRPLLDELVGIQQNTPSEPISSPTGWTAVDRKLDKIISELPKANAPEEFQAIGLFCRECIISLAQAVYDPTIHSTSDGINPSETDAYRMLDAYFGKELAGGSNEALRKHAKSALQLANELQHKTTAVFKNAALCTEATRTVVNLVVILSGKK